MTDDILEMRGITKTFPGVKALSQVTLSVRRGEVHAICGENGAGKSTLMKVLSGVYPYGSYDGEIHFDGEEVQFRSLRDSEAQGIVIIHQELALSPYLSIAENIFLGNERRSRSGLIDWNETNFEAAALLARVGLRENPTTKINQIGVGKQQLVEIAKALSKKVKLLILDEPTAALNDEDSDHLPRADPPAEGGGHHLDHHQPQAQRDPQDRRHGHGHPRRQDDRDHRPRRGHRRPHHQRHGRPRSRAPLSRPRPRHRRGAPPRRELDGTSPAGPDTRRRGRRVHHRPRGRDRRDRRAHGRRTHRVRHEPVRPQLRLAHLGKVFLRGREIKTRTVAEAIRSGLAYATEDRKTYGLNLIEDIKRNVSMASLNKLERGGLVDDNEEYKVANQYRRDLNIKAPNVLVKTGKLSGGNQQKVVLSKWIFSDPEVLILDEPTRGIDVGAKYEIYTIINKLAAAGKGIIVISSELPELLGISDRVYALSEDASPVSSRSTRPRPKRSSSS
ncbi:hypothetical protein LUZ63_021633 [Rhynchospora breviuscula]|uniref:ABC transporter domain-containing protein n=1 Tax=Rhynchospora breviuscula TaxID=2022672 RepID=A0A9P9Z7H3_9POAL|nr:hypothetical protein LUZ63_021633 [Rhynchospora breviuscula]